ncbi:MAG: amino acid adenylation domain-containing protein [Acidobacteriota bacterium]
MGTQTEILTADRNEAATSAESGERGETAWHRIEAQARAHPQRTAFIDGEAEISYRQLTQRAREISAELIARGVEPGSLVGVCMHRSWELAATLLGVFGAGCAYVPLDPGYPRQRLRYMLEHSRAAAAIVDHDEAAALCEGVSELIRLQEIGGRAADELSGPAATAPAANDLAYVIYTSGSTGQPKGVAVEHRSLGPLSESLGALMDEEDLAGVSATVSICFDASVLEIFGVLSLGGTLVLAENALALRELPAVDRLRALILVPSALKALLAAGPLPAGVRTVMLGGEVLRRSLVEQAHALEPRPRLLNVYGPTEDTSYSTATEISAGAETITIGRSVAGSRSYILDEDFQPVPDGTPGELYLAGTQLARGYLYDEERTRERFFVPAAKGNSPQERLYRTGDQCLRRADGEIEFLGRLDQQVKIRGFRVELEEIEKTLASMEGVDGAAAAVVDGLGSQPMLVGYVVSRDGSMSRDAAKAFLAERLPHYMVPHVMMPLEELPLLPSGKLDRGRLPTPDLQRLQGEHAQEDKDQASDPAAVQGARNKDQASDPAANSANQGEGNPRHDDLLLVVQKEIAALLRYDDPRQIPVDQGWADLGLDSLTTAELTARLVDVLGLELPLAAVLEHSTPSALAAHLHQRLGDASAPAEAGTARGELQETLSGFQTQMQACHPPFLAAKSACWSSDDKATFVQSLKRLLSGPGRDPHSKLVRTGSAARGTVADVYTNEEQQAIVWTTNLYLGLNRDPEVIAEARVALDRFGTGMGTSAAASGVTDLHLDFERGFAELTGKESACLFPTGYTANLGAVAGVVGEGDVVILDQLCHASIVDGARLSGAKIRTFQHNSPEDLETVLRAEASPYRTLMVVIEGVYSMGEGAAPVADIARRAKKYGALVLVDEAHSFGFYGERGAGICAAQGATENVDFIMTTLSKALGSLGGIVSASKKHVELLRSSARAFIFQASTSPADIAAAVASLRRLSEDDSLRERLWDTTAYMRRRFTEAGYDLGMGDGPIVTPHFSDKEQLFEIVNRLFRRGVHTSAVTYPIVENGRGRLRFICSAAHTREDVDHTLQALIESEQEAKAVTEAARAQAPEVVSGPSDVEIWARSFAASLQEAPAEDSLVTPSLLLKVQGPAADGLTQILVGEQEVRAGTGVADDATESHSTLPSVSLHLTDPRAAIALCSGDALGVLDCILHGGCQLSGQIEPFQWFFARLVEWETPHPPRKMPFERPLLRLRLNEAPF